MMDSHYLEKRKIPVRIVFAGILVLFAITRLWKLDSLPAGLHIDEAGMAYDAWSLANYGTDRFLKSWPVYLNNFGGGQSSLYAFLCAALFRVFGYSIWLVRLPAVLFSLMTLYFGGKIAQKCFAGHPWLPLIVSGLVTICPYFILASRFGLDCNLMLGMSTVFMYAFMVALERDKPGYYLLCGLMGGLVLYTYVLSYIVMPIFLFVALLYLLWVKRFAFKYWALMAVPMGILAFPLILVQMVNAFGWEEMQLGIFTITKLEIYRLGELGGFQYAHFLQALYSIFLGDLIPYNSIPGFLCLYFITIPLFIVGLVSLLYQFVRSLQHRRLRLSCFPLFWFLIMLLFESHTSANCNKINGIFFAVIFITVEGMRLICSHAKEILRYAVVICIGVIYLVCFMRFGAYYYGGGYALEYGTTLSYFDSDVSEAVELVEENDFLKNKTVYMGQQPIYFALSILRSPEELTFLRDKGMTFENYYLGALPEIKDENAYIVPDRYTDYANEMRDLGFIELKYNGYSLFYKE